MSELSTSLVALRYRNFRLLWLGQLVSSAGTMMQSAAILWHVSLLVPPEQKGLAVGLVGLVRIAPIIIFSLVAGVVADAINRRRLLMVTQSLLTLVAVVLAILTFRGLTALWPLYALTALSSAIAAFDQPARQSLIPSLVPREHFPNAISLNSVMFQLAAVIGPSLGGLIIGHYNVGWAYTFNALSFVAVLLALGLMRGVPPRVEGTAPQISLKAALEGLQFVFRAPLLRSTMLLDFFATFFASATALLPLFAQDVLRVGAQGYGWLYAAPAVGAALTSLIMVRQADRVQRRGLVLLAAVLAYGLATVGFGLSRSMWLSWLCLAATGAADTVSMVFRHVIRQLATPDALRGRMTSVNMIFFQGGPQLGELEAGLVATWLGAPLSVITGGLGAILATAWIGASTPALRDYRRDEPAPVAVTG